MSSKTGAGSVAIPSFIQGISTTDSIVSTLALPPVAIPSFIQGISTQLLVEPLAGGWQVSQSLPLFRAFQLQVPPWFRSSWSASVAIPSFIQGISTAMSWVFQDIERWSRNPFLYSGHFNSEEASDSEGYVVSQSLPLFRAFQPYASLWLLRRSSQVAIPSFIQGISTQDSREIKIKIKYGRNPFLYSGHFNKEKITFERA